jgi:hypothetical protein
MNRAVVLLLVPAACASPAPISIAVPSTVDLVSLLELDAHDRVADGTGLVAWDPTGGLASYSHDSNAILAGYARARLSPLGLPTDPMRVAADRLSIASGCTPHLPPPEFAIRIDTNDRTETIDPSAISPLTADWLAGQCEDVAVDAFSFDLDCKLFRCPLTSTKLDACRYRFSLDCDFGVLDGTLAADGSLCLEASTGSPTCEARTPAAPAIASYHCTLPMECTLDAYRAPTAPFFDLADARVFDVPPYLPPIGITGATPQFPPPGRFVGYTHDVAIVGPSVFVSKGPGTPLESCGSSSIAGTLDIYDRETLVKRSTMPAPACLVSIVADPMSPPPGGGVLGVFILGDAFSLGRFDALGASIASTIVAADPRVPAALDVRCDRVTAMTVLGSPPKLSLVFQRGGGTAECGIDPISFLYLYDLATLALLTVTPFMGASIYATANADDHTIILGDAARIQLTWFDVDANTTKSAIVLPQDVGRNDNTVADVAFMPVLDRALLSIARNSPALYPVDPMSGILTRSIIYEVDVGPIASHTWPTDPKRALVAATNRASETDWPLVVTLFDAESARFLPGARRIGFGAVGRILEDDRGRLWFLLPWEARLVRLTPS